MKMQESTPQILDLYEIVYLTKARDKDWTNERHFYVAVPLNSEDRIRLYAEEHRLNNDTVTSNVKEIKKVGQMTIDDLAVYDDFVQQKSSEIKEFAKTRGRYKTQMAKYLITRNFPIQFLK